MLKTSLLLLSSSIIVYLLLEHIHRRAHDLLDEIEQRGNDFVDETERRVRQLLNDTIAHLNHETGEQINSIVDRNRKYVPLQNPYGATTCTEWFGCHKGHCWAGCAGAFPSVTGPEWCYTTNSHGKVSCTSDGDCDGCWRCTRPCSV